MTHLLDTSAALALLLNEPGGERVAAIFDNPQNIVALSTLTLFELDSAVQHQTGSKEIADRVISEIGQAVAEVVPVTEEITNAARELRHNSTARIATVDCLIAATAAQYGATLVHRDPHFFALPEGSPMQEVLPDKY